MQAASLNPLHCGAVVASLRRGVSPPASPMSQSPSLRGSGRFKRSREMPRRFSRASQSPSLRGSGRFQGGGGTSPDPSGCLNPLHCGAVVASGGDSGAAGGARQVSIPFIAGQWSLPVALVVAAALATLVSIPFIAGQWSLPPGAPDAPDTPDVSQSPSLRGSGRFRSPYGGRGSARSRSQSPSLRGSGRFADGGRGLPRPIQVSIPFIAGQWSLQVGAGLGYWSWLLSQSPSLRGSGRFTGAAGGGGAGARVSIPFIAGQWSLPPAAWRRGKGGPRLNPLHCGAVVAS